VTLLPGEPADQGAGFEPSHPAPLVPPGPVASQGEPDPAWKQPEIAWALAILFGFVGTSVGLWTGLPGLPELLATAAFVPLFLALLARHGALVAGLVGLGWGVGVAGGVLGAAMEGRSAAIEAALPLARAWSALALDPLLGGGESTGGPRALLIGLVWTAAAVLGSLATRGVVGHLLVALALGAVSGAAAGWTLRAVQAGAEPVLAGLLCYPPCTLLALAGCLLAVSAAAAPSSGPAGRRTQLRVGLATAALALLLEPWVGPHWAQAVRSLLPL
jgi:hypothetical protein